MLKLKSIILTLYLSSWGVFSSAQVLEKTRIIDDNSSSTALYSLVAFDNNRSSRTPFIYSSISIYNESINGHLVDYAICKEKTDAGVRLSCLNDDLSVRFVFPDVVGKASRFIDGVSVVNTDKWGFGGDFKYGAISRQGSIILPIEHDYVAQRGDRLVCCDVNDSGCVMITYDISGNELYSLTFTIPSLGVFVQVGDIRREDFGIMNYAAEKTEWRDSFLKAMDDCIHLRYSSAIEGLSRCLQCNDDEIAKAANETIEFIQRTMSAFPLESSGLEVKGLFLRDVLKLKVSLISDAGYNTKSTPFSFDSADVYMDYSRGKEEYYAVCKDSAGRLLCINEDLSLRFTYPEGTVKATPFTAGVATIKNKSSQWGAIDHDGNIILPMEYDLVVVRMDRIVVYDETEKANAIFVYDLAGNCLYTQEFRLSNNKNKIVGKILAEADNEIAICSDREDKALSDEDALLLAIVKCIKLDYDAAYNYLSFCSKSKKCWIRRTANDNIGLIKSLLQK